MHYMPYISDENSSERHNLDNRDVNKYGREVLEFCKATSVRIVNGRSKNDEVGNFICIMERSSSVIDYVMVNNDMLNDVNDFRVGERTKSIHIPLLFSV